MQSFRLGLEMTRFYWFTHIVAIIFGYKRQANFCTLLFELHLLKIQVYHFKLI